MVENVVIALEDAFESRLPRMNCQTFSTGSSSRDRGGGDSGKAGIGRISVGTGHDETGGLAVDGDLKQRDFGGSPRFCRNRFSTCCMVPIVFADAPGRGGPFLFP